MGSNWNKCSLTKKGNWHSHSYRRCVNLHFFLKTYLTWSSNKQMLRTGFHFTPTKNSHAKKNKSINQSIEFYWNYNDEPPRRLKFIIVKTLQQSPTLLPFLLLLSFLLPPFPRSGRWGVSDSVVWCFSCRPPSGQS